VVLAVDGPIEGALMNALLVINAPVVRDGRELPISRTVPESATLLHPHIVTPGVMAQVLGEPLPDETAAVLSGLRLASFPVRGGEPVRDLQGVQVDPTSGELAVNAPDAEGRLRTFRPGEALALVWYRRTDGAHGNVEADAIAYAEQPPRTTPWIAGVRNPLPAFYGADREDEKDGMERLFSSSEGLPVLPADWERAVRQALGARGAGWVVRCWGHAERALLSTALWPLADPLGEAEVRQLATALGRAGPETLLVVLGPAEGRLSDEDLAWAKLVVSGLVRRTARRLPRVREALVGRFWPLRLREGSASRFPCFELPEMRGTLVDDRGRTGQGADAPGAVLLLNAAAMGPEAA
jgi:hypothetical protein